MERAVKYGLASNAIIGKRHVAEKAIKELAGAQAGSVHVKIGCNVNRRLPVGEGFTQDFPVPEDVDSYRFPVWFGGSGLAVGNFRCSDVTALAFTKGLVAALHEVTHCQEMLCQQTDVSDVMIGYSLSQCATIKNPRFYLEDYVRNKREMFAEYTGIRFARLRLQEAFGNNVAEQLLLEYVAWRTLPNEVPDEPGDRTTRFVYPNYFISPASTDDGYYESIADVEKAFDKAMSCNYSGQYCTRSMLTPAPNHMLRDEFVRVMEPLNTDSSWSGVFGRFQEAGSQIESHEMLSSLTCYIHPEYKGSFSNLKDVDLSPEMVFGMPFPETPEEIGARLAKDEAETNSRTKGGRGWHRLFNRLFNKSERMS